MCHGLIKQLIIWELKDAMIQNKRYSRHGCDLNIVPPTTLVQFAMFPSIPVNLEYSEYPSTGIKF